MVLSFGPYDWLLVAVVAAQSALVAYLFQPRWKAFVFMLPFPFTFATLALGQRVDATNVFGLCLVVFFAHLVRMFYRHLKLPIILAIGISAVTYAAAGWLLAGLVPNDDRTFASAIGAALVVALVLHCLQSHRDEPGHRTSLPIWAKLPIIIILILVLVVVKKQLRGFMTMFPMVSIMAAYEARHSLWTLCRHIPTQLFGMAALMTVARWLGPRLGLAAALAIGWIAFLSIVLPLTRQLWIDAKEEESSDRSPGQ